VNGSTYGGVHHSFASRHHRDVREIKSLAIRLISCEFML